LFWHPLVNGLSLARRLNYWAFQVEPGGFLSQGECQFPSTLISASLNERVQGK